MTNNQPTDSGQPPQQYPQYQPYGDANQQQGYQQQDYYQQQYSDPQQDKDSKQVKILTVVAAVLFVALLGVVAALFLTDGNSGNTAQPGGSPAAEFSEQADDGDGRASGEKEATDDAKGKQQQDRPTSAQLPAGVTPANTPATNNEPTGSLNSIWLSGPTSPEFAQSVRDAYVTEWQKTKDNYNLTINAYSPVTGQSYSMNCQDKGSYIHCTGGNDANVYIA